MDEPILYNATGFHADVLPILDREGAQARLAIVKASYRIQPDAPLVLAEQQRELRDGDETWGRPEIADIRLPGDVCLAKPGTDVILSGHALAPHALPCAMVDVVMEVSGRVKRMRVHGPRLWRRGATGVVPGPAQPMRATPLAWSRAYGGLDLTDPAHPLEEPRNPVGSGVSRHVDRLIGTPAPQIEAPGAPIGTAGGRYAPVGCAPIGRHFQPRRQSMGTYDAAWVQSVYPARPADYRDVHEQCAPPDMVFDKCLQGGERVMISGVHADRPLAFELPRWRIVVSAEIDGAQIERRPHLDTVLIDSDALVLELVWRALYRCPPKMRDRFTAVRVQAKEFI